VANLLLLLVCMGLGVLARRASPLPAEAPRVLNAWILSVALPAVVLRSVHRVTWSSSLVLPVVGLWLVFALAALGAAWAVRRGAARGVAGALALGAGLANTSFVGLPLLEALGGAEATGPAVVVDQLGSFVALAVGAVPLAAWLSGQEVSAGLVARRLLRFPPFVALALALALRPVALPAPVDVVLARLGDTLSPLALVSVGLQLEPSALRARGRLVAAGLACRLLAAPAVMLALVWWLSPTRGLVERVAVAQAAMAPMVTGGVLAAEYGLEPRLTSAMIALGVPLSLLTVPAWWWLLGAT
jgi:predicted permease